MSQEMQAILWIAALALLIALVWALWRRTARQSLTVLFLTVGAILVVGGGVPLIWWQLHLPQAGDQPMQIRDHRLVSQTQIKEQDLVRLEVEIEIIIPKLTRERLQAIADEYLREALNARKPDIASVRLKDSARPLLYKYAYRKSLSPESIQPWLQPASSEITAGAHLEEPMMGELEDYRTVTIPVTVTAKWADLQTLLGKSKLPDAWASLDESLYDYIVVAEGDQLQMVIIFALLTEEFLQQYQTSRGRPEELGLLQGEISMPSLLVLVHAVQESLFRISDIALVQKRGESLRRYEPEELSLNEYAGDGTRPLWIALLGNFPSFPNVLAQMRAGSRIIGLVRLPSWLDPSQGFHVYYRDRIATFGRKL
jgi:hypothetical protein